MKNSKFYSLTASDTGKPIATLQDGYYDEQYNLYFYCTKYNSKYGTWHAIDPATGLSVATGNTRKEAHKNATAPGMLKKINDKITQDMITRFNNLVMEAQCL